MTLTFPDPGEVFSERYRIESVLAEGGFGRVYRATQMDLERDVAIKILRPNPKGSDGQTKQGPALEAVIKRFEREARLVSRLRDTHTVTVHDFGSTDAGLLFMVMEFVDGRTVGELINDEGPVEPDRAVNILRQVLSSLQEAHQIGVLHRDIKPHNIMLFDHLGRRDQVKVLDFGLVKRIEKGEKSISASMDLTSEGALIGTPRYMSPEQIRGDEMAPSSDIYSLGLVLFEMLTGERAVDADSTMNIIARHLDPRPFLLPEESGLPEGLRAVLSKMLKKNPGSRYQSVEELLDALESWETGGADAADEVEPDDIVVTSLSDEDVEEIPSEEDRRRSPTFWIAVASGTAFVVTALILVVVLMRGDEEASPPMEGDEPPEEPPAETVAEVAQPDPPSVMVFEGTTDRDAGRSDAAAESVAAAETEDDEQPTEEEPDGSGDDTADSEAGSDTEEEPSETGEPDEEEPKPRPRPRKRPRFKILE